MLVNVSTQAIGNNCYASILAKFLDVFQLIVSSFWTSTLQHTLYEPLITFIPEDEFVSKTRRVLWISGLTGLLLWKNMVSASWWVFGYIMLMYSSVATFPTSLRRVNQAEMSIAFSLCLLVMFFFPDPLGSDLLFFSSPTYQPPVSVAVKKNGWYFRGELVFPFLASIFISTWVSASIIVEADCSNYKFRPSLRNSSWCFSTISLFLIRKCLKLWRNYIFTSTSVLKILRCLSFSPE